MRLRTEKEIIDNIIDVAIKDNNVSAIIRTDLLPVREYLYTYNFYFIVKDVEKYSNDDVFLKCFGERILLYRGDKNYPDANYESIWKAYNAIVELWGKVGQAVAEQCGYHYPIETEKDMLYFIRQLRELKTEK